MGRSIPISSMISKALEKPKSQLEILSIHGMAGAGKSSLVNLVLSEIGDNQDDLLTLRINYGKGGKFIRVAVYKSTNL